jgi:predicted DNA-binding protein (MmcQ/YjbR family)
MTLDDFNTFCRSLPHTTHIVQWGGMDVWKIGGKVFAIAREEDGAFRTSFKCSPMSFELLKDSPGMRPAPYLASRGMIWLQCYSDETLDDDALRDYLRASYRLVAAGLTRKMRAELNL